MVLSRFGSLCGWSWAALGAYVRGPGPSWGLFWRSRAVLGPLFDAMLAVFGRSWDLCWTSMGPMLLVLGGPKRSARSEGPARPAGPDRSEGPVRIFSVDIFKFMRSMGTNLKNGI